MARLRAFEEAEVLQKALDMFWHRGYGITSVDDLVAGAGLNRASLYATFGDKHQLFIRALGHYQQQSCQTLTALLANASAGPPAQLHQILELTLADDQQKGCFMVNTTAELAPHDAEAQALVRQNQQFMENLLTTLLQRGQDCGEMTRSAAPQAQARLLAS